MAGSVLVQITGLLTVAVVTISGTVWWMNNRQPAPSSWPGPPASRISTPTAAQPIAARRQAEPVPENLGAAAPDPQPATGDVPTALEDLISRVNPAVVTIQTSSSRGSGFFVAPDTIITNVHVVGLESTVTVRRPNGTSTTARVQTTSPAFDIAVLKVAGVLSAQPILQLGTDTSIRIGEEVIAIGTPLGFLQNTVSRGIVSGLREVGGSTLVQTDAAINPGNSGGPLLNRSGAVIGIIKSGYVGSDGLAFAVAVDHVRAVLEGRGDSAAASASSTQYDALSPAVAAPADQRRLDATRAYDQAIAQQAARADALDDQWRSFAGQCYQGRIVGAFDRPWFALWDGAAMQGVVASSCVSYFDDLRRRANDIRQLVTNADEAARLADIYPGSRRELLRKYRLDYWTK
jgi:hypothetical protein